MGKIPIERLKVVGRSTRAEGIHTMLVEGAHWKERESYRVKRLKLRWSDANGSWVLVTRWGDATTKGHIHTGARGWKGGGTHWVRSNHRTVWRWWAKNENTTGDALSSLLYTTVLPKLLVHPRRSECASLSLSVLSVCLHMCRSVTMTSQLSMARTYFGTLLWLMLLLLLAALLPLPNQLGEAVCSRSRRAGREAERQRWLCRAGQVLHWCSNPKGPTGVKLTQR